MAGGGFCMKWSEEISIFGAEQNLMGILSQPKFETPEETPKETGIVLFNAGLLPRSGPNRINVTLARLLSAQGYKVIRFDFSGLGDSQRSRGNQLFEALRVEEIKAAMDLAGCKQYVLIGICSGGHDCVKAALEDDRVKGICVIEGMYVPYTARYYLKRALVLDKWIRFLTGKSHFWKRRKATKPKVEGEIPKNAGRYSSILFPEIRTNLHDRKVSTLMVYRRGNETQFNFRIRKDGTAKMPGKTYPGEQVLFVQDADHTFTPLQSQKILYQFIEKWLKVVG